ncbi:class I SAM-dependent methyltransferase [Ralstonia sp. 22111]|uniref:class I SAM-dependent methyltransferase n=1 Tax=Ralstonia sp. 22111 TaxID=3453878 RepID=UPI003F82E978
MQLHDPGCDTIREEMDVLREALQPSTLRIPLRDILEIGCGTGDMTRKIADAWPTVQIRALEVDRIQLARNQARNRHTNISYEAGPAQIIPCESESCDAVMMFKSLHHVPIDLLNQALDEVYRVLRPGGVAWFAEPVFAGELNEIIRLFHDEEGVRRAAFDALVRASADGRWAQTSEIHYMVPVQFRDFADFERKVIRVTHSDFGLTDALIRRVREAFERHMSHEGARFARPMRANLFCKADSGGLLVAASIGARTSLRCV